MDKKYFGTDGIRGKVGEFPITPEFVLKLGWAAGRVLAGNHNGEHQSKVLIGKDTRISGYMFESALEAGLSAAGVDIKLLGPMPTPGIAYLTRTLHAQAGIVISASHNPYYDNGIKFFSAQGTKLPDEVELAIEDAMDRPMVTMDSASLGKAERMEDAAGRYIEFCKSTVALSTEFRGLKIVVDCAHGADYHVAPNVFEEMGAKVVRLAAEPNGLNINDGCGSTHPEAVRKAVLEQGADLGIALDGDGDRVIMVDHRGEIVDGDELLFIIARSRQQEGRLHGAIVGTVMTNLGLEHALKGIDISLVRTPVGDRYILDTLQQQGWTLGGEPSGHIICMDCTTTGDGIVSALQVLAEIRKAQQSLWELKSAVKKYPQTLLNVRIPERIDLKSCKPVQEGLKEAERLLGDRGRVVLRPSGTEPGVRIMVEGEDEGLVNLLARQLASAIAESWH